MKVMEEGSRRKKLRRRRGRGRSTRLEHDEALLHGRVTWTRLGVNADERDAQNDGNIRYVDLPPFSYTAKGFRFQALGLLLEKIPFIAYMV